MRDKFKILFVCTDNVGRSLMAEYLMKDWLRQNGRDDVEVFSAGTDATSDTSTFCFDHFDELKKLEIDTSRHKRTQVSRRLLEDMDLIIVMEKMHQNYIKDHFDIGSVLFNEIYLGEKADLKITPRDAEGTISERLIKMVYFIKKAIPVIISKIST